MYEILTVELDRIEKTHRLRIERRLPDRIIIPPAPGENDPRVLFLDPNLVSEAKMRLKIFLGGIDILVIGASAVAGYFLAGRTLKPIGEMVEEQKRFVADASHELRTPLTAMKTEVEVALRDKNMNLKSAKELLGSNLEEVDKLKSLTDYFLTLNKYQDNLDSLTFESFDLSAAARQVSSKMKSIANEKKIEIDNKISPVTIRANKTSIVELIGIFLDNAIKYTQPGGNICLTVEKTKEEAIIKIQDSGIGIKKEDIPNIFKRFYRADISRSKNEVKGYGLGLAIAKNIVDLHKGKIAVESSDNKGSLFTITLPLKQSHRSV